jgi:hypothetical protein
MPKLKKPPRKIGEKPKKPGMGQRLKLPAFPDPRVPGARGPLLDFILSCEGEVTMQEAIKDYQDNWCDHPRQQRYLISTMITPGEERAEHTVACGECGRHRVYQGRPGKELK